MLFTCAEDFFEKSLQRGRLSREEEKTLFLRMKAGDASAHERMVESYLVIVAATIKRLPKEHQSLDLIYHCVQALEQSVDKFDFLQDGEAFLHRLSLVLRGEITKHIAKQGS